MENSLQVDTKKKYYEMNGVRTEGVQGVKDVGVTAASNLIFFHQFRDAAGKANRMLDFIKQISPSKIKM